MAKARLTVGSRRSGYREGHQWDLVVQETLEAQEALGDLVGPEGLETRHEVEAVTLGVPCTSLMVTRQGWRH